MNTPISILAEIPEELHESLKDYLDTHPNWDQDRVFAAALSLFLSQNKDKKVNCTNEQQLSSNQNDHAMRVYLETLFQQS